MITGCHTSLYNAFVWPCIKVSNVDALFDTNCPFALLLYSMVLFAVILYNNKSSNNECLMILQLLVLSTILELNII